MTEGGTAAMVHGRERISLKIYWRLVLVAFAGLVLMLI